MKQKGNESLRDFVIRFKEELLLVDDLHSKGATIAFKESLRKDSLLVKHLVKYGILDTKEALSRAKRHIRLEEESSWSSNIPESIVATISAKPSIVPALEARSPKKKQGSQTYFFQPQNSKRKRKFPLKENKEFTELVVSQTKVWEKNKSLFG